MTVLCVPGLEEEPWPSLGPAICDFIEQGMIHGPGDLRGMPAKLSDEQRGLIYRAYEVYPRRHQWAGRRRFKRVAVSLQKGSSKTEWGAWIVGCELHPDAPVRTVGWGVRGDPTQPYGGGVTNPYIPIINYSVEQAEDLAFAVLLYVLSEGPLAADFDCGLERIMRRNGDGKAVALSASPNAREGNLLTFAYEDETHLWVLPRLLHAHQVIQMSVGKRKLADPWVLETTTAPVPGQGSVAERTMQYAQEVADGKHKDPRLFFFHRQASDEHDMGTEKGRRAAVIEAAGPNAKWKDIDGIVQLARDPTVDLPHWIRVWTNRAVQSSDQAFDVGKWRQLAREGYEVAPGSLITLGFDGSRYDDSTGLHGVEVETGFTWPIGIWEKPAGIVDWTVPEDEVDAAVTSAFETFNVWRMAADPYWWEGWLAVWAGRWGDRVVKWPTNRWLQMGHAIRNLTDAILTGEISHDGDERVTRHLGNARRKETSQRDAEGRPLYVITKERGDSPHKIDAAMSLALGWEARTDAIAAGATGRPVEWAAV